MAVVGIGLDVVDLVRLKRTLDELGDRFMERICTPAEAEYCRSSKRRSHERLGARFAAKEALGKALGVGMTQGVVWQEIEVVHDSRGCPELVLHGHTQRTIEERGVEAIHLSLSHDGDVAAAVVVLEGER